MDFYIRGTFRGDLAVLPEQFLARIDPSVSSWLLYDTYDRKIAIEEAGASFHQSRS